MKTIEQAHTDSFSMPCFFPHYFNGHRNAARFDFDYTITNYGKVHILLFASMYVCIQCDPGQVLLNLSPSKGDRHGKDAWKTHGRHMEGGRHELARLTQDKPSGEAAFVVSQCCELPHWGIQNYPHVKKRKCCKPGVWEEISSQRRQDFFFPIQFLADPGRQALSKIMEDSK